MKTSPTSIRPTIETIYQQKYELTKLFKTHAPKLFQGAKNLKSSGNKDKRIQDNATSERECSVSKDQTDNTAPEKHYSILNYQNELYVLSRENLYYIDNYNDGLVRGKLAMNKDGQFFFMKSITFETESLKDKENETNFKKIKQGLKQEIAIAHANQQAPSNKLVERKSKTHTKLYLMTNFMGPSIDLWMTLKNSSQHIIALSNPQRAEMAIKSIQQVLELYREGWTHRDIKPDNYTVDIKQGQLLVSLIDWNRTILLPIQKNKTNNALASYYSDALVPGNFEYLPKAYQQKLSHYYYGPATDLFAAAKIAKEILEQYFMEQSSQFEKNYYQKIKDLCTHIEQTIERSCLEEPNVGHPKVYASYITEIEQKLLYLSRALTLLPMDLSLLTTHMARQQLKKHAYDIANTIYKYSKSDTDFITALPQNFEYQTVFEAFSTQFPLETDIISAPKLLSQHSELEALSEASLLEHEKTGTQHWIFCLKETLEALDLYAPQFIAFHAVLNEMHQDLDNPEQINSQNVLHYVRRIDELLEEHQLLEHQQTWRKIHQQHVFTHNMIHTRFSPGKTIKAAQAIVSIYSDYLKSAESPEKYAAAQKIYAHFIQNRTAIEHYYVSQSINYQDKLKEIIQQYFIDALLDHASQTTHKDLNQLFQNTPIEILIPTEIWCLYQGISTLSHYESMSQMFLQRIYTHFFEDPLFFQTLFIKLKTRVGQEDYPFFLYRLFHPTIAKGNVSPGKIKFLQFQYEEELKLRMTLNALLQPLLNLQNETSTQKIFSIHACMNYFFNIYTPTISVLASNPREIKTAVQIILTKIQETNSTLALENTDNSYWHSEANLASQIFLNYVMPYWEVQINDLNNLLLKHSKDFKKAFAKPSYKPGLFAPSQRNKENQQLLSRFSRALTKQETYFSIICSSLTYSELTHEKFQILFSQYTKIKDQYNKITSEIKPELLAQKAITCCLCK